MNENLFKAKTDMILEELKNIERRLKEDKRHGSKKAYSRACIQYNTFLEHIDDIPELDEEKKEALRNFIVQRKLKFPQNEIVEVEIEFSKRQDELEALKPLDLEEKKKADPAFFKTNFPKTKEELVLDEIKKLELESLSTDEDNFMLKSAMSSEEIKESLNYLLGNLKDMPDLTDEQRKSLEARISSAIISIDKPQIENSFEKTKTNFEKKSLWRKLKDKIKERQHSSHKNDKPDEYINFYR